jgi:hypothetical protein
VLCDTRFANCPRCAADLIESRRPFAELLAHIENNGIRVVKQN